MSTNPITQAIDSVGLGVLAAGLCVSGQAVRKWEAAGHLPRTEWTGETDYSAAIQRITEGRVSREALLACRPPRRGQKLQAAAQPPATAQAGEG